MKSAFLDEVKAELLPDGKWRLLADLRYYSESLRRTVEVPAGFETDFASVPRLPLAFLLTGDTAHAAAVVHDWLCEHPGQLGTATIDRVFREAAEASGVPWWRRWVMFGAIRAADWVGARK